MKKFKTLFLHVGLEKTGTTSIQRALDVHRDKFEKLGYYYPKAFAVGRNTLLATMFAKDPNKKAFKAIIKAHGGTFEKFKENLTHRLSDEYKQTPAKGLILSSELLAHGSDLEAVKAYCDKWAENTTVIVYLREQASLAMSLYSTFIKSGGVEFNTLELLREGQLPEKLNFKSMLQKWQACFPEQIKVRLFDKSTLIDGDAISDFCHQIGLGGQTADLKIRRENETLSLAGVELLSVINNVLPNFIDGLKNPARRALIADFANFDDPNVFGRLGFRDSELKEIHNICRSSNAWVRNNFFPDQERLFSPQQGRENGPAKSIDIIELAALIIKKAYTDLHSKQELLDYLAPHLTKLSNQSSEISNELKKFNRLILQNRQN